MGVDPTLTVIDSIPAARSDSAAVVARHLVVGCGRSGVGTAVRVAGVGEDATDVEAHRAALPGELPGLLRPDARPLSAAVELDEDPSSAGRSQDRRPSRSAPAVESTPTESVQRSARWRSRSAFAGRRGAGRR